MEELKKMTPLDLKPKEIREQYANLIQPLLAGEINQLRMQTKHLRKDRTTYDVDILLYALPQEEPPVLLAYVEDITEKLAISEKVRYAQKMETIGNLTGDFAHDFNNHLTAIKGTLTLLRRAYSKLEKEERETLDLAIHSAERCARLIRDLLAFSERQHLKWAEIEVNEFLGEFHPFLRAAIDESIEIEIHPSAGKVFIEVDTEELKNSLLNLADNARAAMPGGGNLTIEVAVKDIGEKIAGEKFLEPGEYAVVSVSDNGIGMTPAVMKKIFEPFFTTREVGQGSGLGLSAVFGFMKQMEGTITVYSELGMGTTFRLYFPAVKKIKKAAPQKKSMNRTKTSGSPAFLLVEDDADVREFTARALAIKGIDVFSARDGSEALRIIKHSKTIDFLLCDVFLPGGVIGTEIGKACQNKFPNGGILYISGYTIKSIEKKGLNIEKQALLSKPYDLEELVERIDAITPGIIPRRKK